MPAQATATQATGEAVSTQTVWKEHVSWLDRVPRSVAMIVLMAAGR